MGLSLEHRHVERLRDEVTRDWNHGIRNLVRGEVQLEI